MTYRADTDTVAVISGNGSNLLTAPPFALFSDASVRDSIAQGLSHDFAPDYTRVLGAARKAIGARREGDFLLSADVTSVENGTLSVTGKGLFMPVRATGQATIAYRPEQSARRRRQ